VRLDEGEVGEAGEGAPAPSGAALLDFDGADCPPGFVVGEDIQVRAGGEPQDHVFEGAEPAVAVRRYRLAARPDAASARSLRRRAPHQVCKQVR
jgi:hypothetical protein